MTDLNALSVFARVAEASSFSEAARRLGMPVSSVSRRVAELEDRLGVRLVERSTRRLRLTATGAEILPLAQRCAELGEAVAGIVSHSLAEVSGTLRLSAPPSLSDALVVPVIRAFQAAHPRVRVALFVTQRRVDPIADGIDLMLRVGDLADSALIARRLLRYRHQLVASPAYLAAAGTPRAPAELASHRLIAFAPAPGEQRWRFAHPQHAEGVTVAVTPALAMNDYAGIAEAALGGAGIAELPPMIGARHLEAGRLVELLPGWHLPARDLSLLQPPGRHVARPVRVFADLAIRLVPELFPRLPA